MKAWHLLSAAGLLLGAVVAVGCLPDDAPGDTTDAAAVADGAPPEARYRDRLFSDIAVERDIEYATAPDLQDQRPVSLALDLYRPATDAVTRRPALIWVHGGGFAKGDKTDKRAVTMATQFAQLGYVAVSINYRLLDGPACSAAKGVSPTCFNAGVEAVHDAQAAVRWLRANAVEYGIDVDRIAIAGESAGAIVATGVGVSSDYPGEGNNPEYPSAVRAWVSISGGLPGGIFVDAADPAGLLFAGTEDKTVPYRWSVETADAMLNAGATAVLEPLEGAGHLPWDEYGERFQQESNAFLYTHLDLAWADR
jgi:predicted esterase